MGGAKWREREIWGRDEKEMGEILGRDEGEIGGESESEMGREGERNGEREKWERQMAEIERWIWGRDRWREREKCLRGLHMIMKICRQ